ncbi:MAG: hypothetical protein V1824_02340 [archaeon]
MKNKLYSDFFANTIKLGNNDYLSTYLDICKLQLDYEKKRDKLQVDRIAYEGKPNKVSKIEHSYFIKGHRDLLLEYLEKNPDKYLERPLKNNIIWLIRRAMFEEFVETNVRSIILRHLQLKSPNPVIDLIIKTEISRLPSRQIFDARWDFSDPILKESLENSLLRNIETVFGIRFFAREKEYKPIKEITEDCILFYAKNKYSLEIKDVLTINKWYKEEFGKHLIFMKEDKSGLYIFDKSSMIYSKDGVKEMKSKIVDLSIV